MKNKNGITLIALIVTIIVLLILAGVTIATLTSENGLLNTTKKAREEQEISAAKESLVIELSKILTDELGNKDLSKLDGLSINGYTTEVGNLGKIVTMTKNNESYYFLVDSNYEIHDLNSASEGTVGNVSGDGEQNTGKPESDLITAVNLDYKLHASNIEFTVSSTTQENEEVKGYLVYCDNELYKVITEEKITIKNLTRNTNYDIYFEALDKNGNSKKSEVLNLKTLNAEYKRNNIYAIITSDGIKNIKMVNVDDSADYYYEDLNLEINEASYFSSDALTKIVYDSKDSTYIDLGRSDSTTQGKTGYIQVDKNMWNKKIVCKCYTDGASGYEAIYFYNSNKTNIGYIIGENHGSKVGSGQYYDEFTIPQNTTYINFAKYNSGNTIRLYDISVKQN